MREMGAMGGISSDINNEFTLSEGLWEGLHLGIFLERLEIVI